MSVASITQTVIALSHRHCAQRTGELDWSGFGMLSLGIGAMQLLLDPGEEREARDDPASRARARA